MKPSYYLSNSTISMFANRIPRTDEENDVQQLAREFLINEKRLHRALVKLAKRMKEAA